MELFKDYTRLPLFTSFLLLTLLQGCSDSDNNNDNDTPDNNFTASSLSVVTAAPQIAYPLALDVELLSEEDADHVGVSFLIVEKTDDPDATPREFPLGSDTITPVSRGTETHRVTMEVPSSIELSGEYYIVALIDPADEQDEWDEEDNTASTEISLANDAGINLFISDLVLDRASLEISTLSYEEEVNALEGNVYNADAGSTLTVGTHGMAPDETIEIEAYATLVMARSDKQYQSRNTALPLGYTSRSLHPCLWH